MRLNLTAATAAIALTAGAALADDVTLIYSDTVPENDIRSQLLQTEFADCLGEGFTFEAHHGATLFAQGTELTAMQRGNLDMANLAIFDFQNQVPSTSVLGVPFLFRDYDHMRAVYDGDVLADLEAEIADNAKVKILAYPYIGARHLSYVSDDPEHKIMNPEELKGMKIRFPGGEGWQFVGTAMGATPVPIAFTEVYTALQTGAIDGQDNGFPATHSMKFDEILTHMGLTNHLIAANEFTIGLDKWNSMDETQQAKVQECALNFQAAIDAETIRLEEELKQTFVDNGMVVYEPDNAAFQAQVYEVYSNSDYSKDWPAGLYDAIVAVGQ